VTGPTESGAARAGNPRGPALSAAGHGGVRGSRADVRGSRRRVHRSRTDDARPHPPPSHQRCRPPNLAKATDCPDLLAGTPVNPFRVTAPGQLRGAGAPSAPKVRRA
jgi:hypothetical protein